ncbi:hypothetical protein ACFV0T_11180 [Streptomyces sp. NPDC059582]|uniref:hypothetical protein n=1 Tax=Streptomyces sp. NPDC059582 TaxID=3346875 RepID=UPI0036898FC1
MDSSRRVRHRFWLSGSIWTRAPKGASIISTDARTEHAVAAVLEPEDLPATRTSGGR